MNLENNMNFNFCKFYKNIEWKTQLNKFFKLNKMCYKNKMNKIINEKVANMICNLDLLKHKIFHLVKKICNNLMNNNF
jgi:hypothetical protein